MNAASTAPRPRRSPRDWVVDAGLFLLAAVYWVLTTGGRLKASTHLEPAWLFTLDELAGVLGCAALWLRRRWPVELAVALVMLSTFSELVTVAMVVALFTVAVHQPPRTAAFVFAFSLLAPLAYVLLRPQPGTSSFLLFLLGVAVQGGAVGWACSFVTGASWCCRCATARPTPRTRRACGPSRRSTVPARRSPGRCTTCSATGCRC